MPLLRMPLLRSPTILPTFRPHHAPLTNTPRVSNSRLFNHFPARLTSSPPPPESSSSLPPDATRYQRLKHLFKTYGWYALGMYICIGFLDFGVAFSLINIVGAEYVERLTTSAKGRPEPGLDELDPAPSHGGHEGLMAMVILAYTVHKTLFLPVRVGLTAYLTPTLVGWLRQRGWAGGAGTVRAATHMRERLRSGKNKPPRGD
ncbi:Peptide alpha-n-acetyltransferase [Mycena venus]|uniref:Peptide alpha-n-acetyltransferase n=1 Tax=Mycena venus TaxID=2733690 RepID=A0A8H6YPJ9_9AGAR|nr:Peptide alpha-n-acetyltransferase [Mycena venus]